MLQVTKTLFILYFTLGMWSCSTDCPECIPGQENINFSFRTPEGVDLLHTNTLKTEDINIFYHDGDRVLPANYSVIRDEESGKAYIQSGDIGYLCHKGIHNFAITRGMDTISELDIIYTQKSDSERCCTWYSAEFIYADGIALQLKQNDKFGGVTVETVIE